MNRFAHWRRTARIAWATARDLTPPPPEAFASFGTASIIVPPARVQDPQYIEIGSQTEVMEHAWLSVINAIDGLPPKLTIGNRVRLGPHSHVACVGRVTIEDDVLTGARIFIADSYHGYEDSELPIIRQPMADPKPVRICTGSFLGLGSIVLQGVTIGEHAYVGAGSVVTSDVPPRSVVVGNPARVVRQFSPGEGWVSRSGD